MARIRIVPTAEALAEFRGFFFGEGHIDMARQGKGEHNLYPRIRIDLRDDDEATLRWCVELFGGCITRRAATRSACWQLTGKAAVAEVISVLQSGVMPARKRRQLNLAAEALALVRPRAGICTRTRIAPEVTARLFAIREELKAARRYQSREV